MMLFYAKNEFSTLIQKIISTEAQDIGIVLLYIFSNLNLVATIVLNQIILLPVYHSLNLSLKLETSISAFLPSSYRIPHYNDR